MRLMGEENKEDKDDLPDFIKVPSIKHPDANCLAVNKASFFLSDRVEYFLMNEVQEFKKKFRFVGEDLISKVTILDGTDQLNFQKNYGRT